MTGPVSGSGRSRTGTTTVVDPGPSVTGRVIPIGRRTGLATSEPRTSRRTTSGLTAPGGREIKDEARATFPKTVVPRDFDVIEVPFPEKGEPSLVRDGARGAPA